jgi:hypothetical protein
MPRQEKISKAFVEGRQIEIEGGKVYVDSDWYQCINVDETLITLIEIYQYRIVLYV